MEYKFWKLTDGNAPVEKAIEDLGAVDIHSSVKLISKLEHLKFYSFD